MKLALLILGIGLSVRACEAKPRLRLAKLTLRYEMKKSLHSLPASSTHLETENTFTLSVSDNFIVDAASDAPFAPLPSQPRSWKGEFQVAGQTQMTDGDKHYSSIVRGGRALKKAEMPAISLQRAAMGEGNELAFDFDFPAALDAQTAVTEKGQTLKFNSALSGATPPCLADSAGETVFRQSIEAKPPLSRRPTDAFGARTYDSWKGLQKSGKFWLAAPVFWTLKRAAPDVYTLNETQAFPFRASTTETEAWTQSLTLKLELVDVKK